MNPKGKQLYLQPDEAKFLSMAVVSAFELINENSKNPRINWTPESRRTQEEMLTAAKRLKIKLANLGFDMRPLPPLADGEENDYLTKPS